MPCVISHKDLLYDLAVDIGETVMTSLETVGEAFVIDSEAIQDGGLQVMHVDWVFSDIEREIVGGAVSDAGFDPATGQPH
jgi:hypothetical protein